MTSHRRLTILDEATRQELYQLPQFDAQSRAHYFILPKTVWGDISSMNINSQIYFILQYGYFGAKRQFFELNYQAITNDIEFVINNYFQGKTVSIKMPGKNTRTNIRKKITKIFLPINASKESIKKQLMARTIQIIKYNQKPKEIFNELYKFIDKNQLMMPSYTDMQNIIGKVITDEEIRLCKILDENLTDHISSSLDNLLTQADKFYRLTEIKQDLKNFNYKQMNAELKKYSDNKTLYQFAEKILPMFKLSQGNIKNYADLALFYSIYKLKRLPKNKCYLYLLCYIYCRHQKISENIAQAFIYLVDKYRSQAIIYAKSIIAKEKTQLKIDQKKTSKLLGFFDNESLFKLSFETVANKAYKIIPRKTLASYWRLIGDPDDYQNKLIWQYYQENYRTITMRLKPLFKSLVMTSGHASKSVFKAADFMQSVFLQEKSLARSKQSNIPKTISNYSPLC